MENHLKKLIAILKLLSSDFEIQKKSFPDFVEVADELALSFYDYMLQVGDLMKAKLINNEQYKNLKKLDNFLKKMSGEKNASFWTQEALKFDPRWKKIRLLSKKILDSFEISLKKDKFQSLVRVKYVKLKN